jgi:hypothetical protein
MITFGLGYGFGPAVLGLFLVGGSFDRPLAAAAIAVPVSLFFLGLAGAIERARPAHTPQNVR